MYEEGQEAVKNEKVGSRRKSWRTGIIVEQEKGTKKERERC